MNASRTVLGMLYDALREETYIAEHSRGATLNGESIEVSSVQELRWALLVTGFPYNRDEMPAALEHFRRFAKLMLGMRR